MPTRSRALSSKASRLGRAGAGAGGAGRRGEARRGPGPPSPGRAPAGGAGCRSPSSPAVKTFPKTQAARAQLRAHRPRPPPHTPPSPGALPSAANRSAARGRLAAPGGPGPHASPRPEGCARAPAGEPGAHGPSQSLPELSGHSTPVPGCRRRRSEAEEERRAGRPPRRERQQKVRRIAASAAAELCARGSRPRVTELPLKGARRVLGRRPGEGAGEGGRTRRGPPPLSAGPVAAPPGQRQGKCWDPAPAGCPRRWLAPHDCGGASPLLRTAPILWGVLSSRPLGGAAPTYAPKPTRAAGDCPLELRFVLCFLLFLPLSNRSMRASPQAWGRRRLK